MGNMEVEEWTCYTEPECTGTRTAEALKESIQGQIRKSWNTTHFLEGKRKKTQQRAVKTLWVDGRLTNFNPKTGLIVDLS